MKAKLIYAIVDTYNGQVLCDSDLKPLQFRGLEALRLYVKKMNLNPELFQSKIMGYVIDNPNEKGK